MHSRLSVACQWPQIQASPSIVVSWVMVTDQDREYGLCLHLEESPRLPCRCKHLPLLLTLLWVRCASSTIHALGYSSNSDHVDSLPDIYALNDDPTPRYMLQLNYRRLLGFCAGSKALTSFTQVEGSRPNTDTHNARRDGRRHGRLHALEKRSSRCKRIFYALICVVHSLIRASFQRTS